MLTIPRSLARTVRAVFKRALGARRHDDVWVRVHAESGVLALRATAPQAAVEYRVEGQYELGEASVPLELLTECEAKSEDPIRFESPAADRVVISWDDRGIPQQRSVDLPKKLPDFPQSASVQTTNEPGFLQALVDACATTDPESTRFALGCINLRGGLGSMAATDGRHLLVQKGFSFPWPGDCLVPANKFFGSRELPPSEPVIVGHTGDWATFTIGPWSLWLRINREGRFPKVDDMVRPTNRAPSRLLVDAEDARFAVDALKRLPLDRENGRPVTLDLNGEVIVRAKSEADDTSLELMLTTARLIGQPVQVATSADYLGRALSLGFGEIAVFGEEAALQASDASRHYIWMPFAKETVIQSSATARRITAQNAATTVSRSPAAKDAALKQSNATSTSVKPMPELQAVVEDSSIDQVTALRASLRETLAKTNELLRALKRERQQSRLVTSTLASLKQLQKSA